MDENPTAPLVGITTSPSTRTYLQSSRMPDNSSTSYHYPPQLQHSRNPATFVKPPDNKPPLFNGRSGAYSGQQHKPDVSERKYSQNT